MEHKNKTKKVRNGLNAVLVIITATLWINIIIIKGTAGAASWALLKLIFAPLGVILTVITLTILIIGVVKKELIIPKAISLILALTLAFPILMLLNVAPMKYPIEIKDVSPSVTIHSPFKESVLVGWGGDAVENNAPHVIWASERWAYDLVMEPSNMGSNKLEDYGIYQKDIYAPIAGEVIAAYDEENNITPNSEEILSMEGNYVYIKIDETQTYLLMNHLQKNSVKVKVGDRLKIGDYIGKIGNSGSTSEPHLHIHHQRQNPIETIHQIVAEGLPLYFYNENNESTMPIKGNKI